MISKSIMDNTYIFGFVVLWYSCENFNKTPCAVVADTYAADWHYCNLI